MGEPSDLAAFEAELFVGPTATEALRRWCAARNRHVGRVTAHLIGTSVRASPASIALLACVPSEIRHRRVELRWGQVRLSIADNWYVPARLSPEMNTRLQDGDTPFGELVSSLGVVRRVIAPNFALLRRTASSPAERKETEALLRQDAILVIADTGLPLAAVSETYLTGLLELG